MKPEAILKMIAGKVIHNVSNLVHTSNFVPSNNAFVRSEQAKAVSYRSR